MNQPNKPGPDSPDERRRLDRTLAEQPGEEDRDDETLMGAPLPEGTLADPGPPPGKGGRVPRGTQVGSGPAAPPPGDEPPDPPPFERAGTFQDVDSVIMVQPKDDSKGPDPLIGQVIGGCRILERIGEGAMGKVYKANQLSLDRIVAVKTIRRELVRDSHLLERFQREAKTVGKFSTPYVVQIHQVGVQDGLHYLLLEYVAGGSLHDFTVSQPGQRLATEQALDFLQQSVQGLLDAERLEIVHRDIKPENLLLDHNRRIKIADFGVAKSLSGTVEMTSTGAVIGTPLYMSPEQCSGGDLDHRSDMYSLGATFAHLMTGRPPIKGNSVYELIKRKTEAVCISPREITQDQSVPGPINSVIERMTRLDMEDRYPTFQDLLDDLRRIGAGQEPSPPPPLRRRARGAPTPLIAAAVFLVLAGGGFLAWRLGWLAGLLSPPSGTGTGGEAAQLTAQQAETRLAELRADLRDLKPSANLATQCGELQRRSSGLSADLQGQIAALVKDANRQPTFQRDLVQMRASRTGIRIPFTGLESYWKNLRETADLYRADAGPELREHLDRTLADEADKDAREAAALAAGSSDSIGQRLQRIEAGEGISDAALRTLKQDLSTLEEAQRRLATLFPDRDWAADGAFVLLADFRHRIESQTGAVSAETDPRRVEVLARLGDLRQQLRTEPTRPLEAELEELRRSLPPSWPEGTKQVESLLSDVGLGLRITEKISEYKPDVAMPFDALASDLGKLREQLEPKATYGPELREYVNSERASREASLWTFTETRLKEFSSSLQDAGSKLDAGELTLEQLGSRITAAGKAETNLRAVFPEKEELWSAYLSPSTLQAAREALAERRSHLDELSALRGDLERLEGQIAGGAAQGSGVEAKRFEELARAVDDLEARLQAKGAFAFLDAGPELDRIGKLRERLAETRQLAQACTEVIRLVDAGRLAAARTALKDLTRHRDLEAYTRALGEILDDLDQAFAYLLGRIPDPVRSRDTFRRAEQRTAGLVGAEITYPKRCVQASEELLAAVREMTPISAGSVRLFNESEKTEVAAFFMDNCETSVGEYQQFVRAAEAMSDTQLLELLGDTDIAAARKTVRFPSYPEGADATQRPRWPVEYVTVDQARAYLRFRGRSLPTYAEWWRAAKGSLEEQPEHRAGPWTSDSAERLGPRIAKGERLPQEIDAGDTCVEFNRMYHLVGNVEEWVEDGKGGHYVMGGSYKLTANLEVFFFGRPRNGERTPQKGVGFRGVLRPREFLASHGVLPR